MAKLTTDDIADLRADIAELKAFREVDQMALNGLMAEIREAQEQVLTVLSSFYEDAGAIEAQARDTAKVVNDMYALMDGLERFLRPRI